MITLCLGFGLGMARGHLHKAPWALTAGPTATVEGSQAVPAARWERAALGYQKMQFRSQQPCKAAAHHVCFHCQSAELHPAEGEKGKGEESSAETNQTPNNSSPQQNKALKIHSPLGSPSPHESSIFWANYTGCSEPSGIKQAAKSDIKGENFKINT